MATEETTFDRSAAEETAHLERMVIDAFYLGHALADFGARRDCLLSGPTRLAANAVLSWARMAANGLETDAFRARDPAAAEKASAQTAMASKTLSG